MNRVSAFCFHILTLCKICLTRLTRCEFHIYENNLITICYVNFSLLKTICEFILQLFAIYLMTMETMENLSHDSWSLGQDLNPGPPEYEAGMLTTWPRHSFLCLKETI
jgi:hypothetical protein